MGNPAQWSFHALRTHPGLGGTHLSYRATWVLLDQGPSWRQGSRTQPVNQAQDLSEQGSWHCDLGKLERDVAAMSHDLCADLHLLLSQCLLRLVFDLLRQYRLLLMAMSGCSAVSPLTSAFGQKADLHGVMSAFLPITSALPPASDVLSRAAEGPLVTQAV